MVLNHKNNINFRISKPLFVLLILQILQISKTRTKTKVFLLCPFAAKVWDLAPGINKPDATTCSSFPQLLQGAKLMRTLPPTCLASSPLFPWILWNLWKARNKLIFEDKSFSELETVTKAIRDAKEWESSHQPLPKPNRIKNPPSYPNQGPRPGSHTCYVDAAWTAHSCHCDMGWTLTSPDASTTVSYSANRTHVASALVAEALAMRSALILASAQPEIASLTVFTDSQVLVTLINAKESTTELKGILHDITLLCNSFASISFVYVPRSASVKADSLATSALQALNSSSLSGV